MMKLFVYLVTATVVAVQNDLCAAAQVAEDTMEHVLVTAPLHKTNAETALPVTVLEGDELRNSVAASLGETLVFEPGLSSTSYGPGVGKPVIRGQTGPRVLVLQNGLASQDASTLSPDHANASEPFLADRIEVIKGPAALLYGSGAIGGVVNVIDGRIPSTVPEGLEGAVSYRHNTVDDGNTTMLKLDGGGGAIAVHIDALYSENNDVRIPGAAVNIPGELVEDNTDGYIGNSNGRNSSFTAGGSWVQSWGYVGASASHLEKNYGIPPGVHQGHDHDEHMEAEHESDEEALRIDMEQDRFDLKSEINHPLDWLEVARIQLANTRYTHSEIEADQIGTTYDNDAWNLRVEMVHHALAGWHGAFGLDAGSRDFEAYGEEAFVPESFTRNLGLFLLEDRHFNNWSLELGLRGEYQQIDPEDRGLEQQSFVSWSASAATIWSLNSYNNITVALSASQRPPFVEELYANVVNIDSGNYVEHGATGSVEIGDPGLGNETSSNAEIGWTHFGDAYNASINLFYNYFSDYIYLRNTGLLYNPEECSPQAICGPELADEGAPVLAYSQEAATFRGIEAEFGLPLWQRDEHQMELRLFGDYVRGTLDDSDDDVPRMPPARLGASLNYDAYGWSSFIRVLHGFEQDKPGANETPTDAYTRVDAGVFYDLATASTRWQLFVKANNLTNAEIRNSSSYLRNYAPEPGRGFELGVSLSF